MKLGYIAGAYTGNTTYEVRNNIRRAEQVAEWAWSNGIACITPHTNSQFLDGLCPYEIWAEGYKEIMKRTRFDVMFLVPGWESSSGTAAEIALAARLNLLVLQWSYEYDYDDHRNVVVLYDLDGNEVWCDDGAFELGEMACDLEEFLNDYCSCWRQ